MNTLDAETETHGGQSLLTDGLAGALPWENAMVQPVYALLYDTPGQPTSAEHWEGWAARLIVGQVLPEPVAWMVEGGITVREDMAAMLGWTGAVVGTGRAIPKAWRPLLYAPMRPNVELTGAAPHEKETKP